MKKIFATALLTALLSVVQPLQAQLYLEENFEYTQGDLLGQGGWVRYGSATANPIQVTGEQLSYAGYTDTPTGYAVELKNLSSSDQDLCKQFIDDVQEGTVYYSMLLNVKDINDDQSGNYWLAALLQKRGTTFADGYTGNAYAKLYAKKTAAGRFVLGINRYSNNENHYLYTTAEYDMNQTYLVVVKYEIVGDNTTVGNQDDIISLFVNPAIQQKEPAATLTYGADSNSGNTDFRINTTAYTPTGGLCGIQLMQNRTATKNAANALVANLRVAGSWAALMKQSGSDDPDNPDDPNNPDNPDNPDDPDDPDNPDNPDYGTIPDADEQELSATNLLSNGGFEAWQTSIFGTTPQGWETTLGECTAEESNKIEGEKALRLTAGKNATSGKLRQDINSGDANNLIFVPGEQYRMVLYYYVETASTDDNDITLNSYWKHNDDVLTQDADVLNSGEAFTSVGQWARKTVVTTVPEGATGFYYSLHVGKNAVVLFDRMSFHAYEGTEPQLLLSETAASFITTLGTPVTKQFTVKAQNIANDIALSVVGTDRQQFSVSPATIPAGQRETLVTITYNPTAASAAHRATLIVDPQTEGLSGAVALTGANYDPQNPPSITADVTSLAFETTVGSSETKTVGISSQNILDYFITARVVNTSLGLFTLSTTSVVKNTPTTLSITFTPKVAGSYSQTVELVSTFAETVRISLTGTATGQTDPVVEGDQWPLTTANARTLLNEDFSSAGQKNKTLSIDGWKNIAEKGGRAWWSYEFADGEKTAKVTAYNSLTDDTYDAEQWLITPPLDFKNAANRVFTFRVMGQYLPENGSEDLLEVLYMDMDGDELYSEVIEGLNIPATSDVADEWNEIHLNLNGEAYEEAIADVFFIGFRFTTPNGGRESSTVYYIDDVSWGRTDIPTITASVLQVAEEVTKDTEWTSQPITVTTTNTTEPVTLSLGGSNPSKFKLSTTELPKEGGQFTLTFSSDQEGVHEAYVKLSSRGAADAYIPLSINNKSVTTGIAAMSAAAEDKARYDLQGRAVRATQPGLQIMRMADGSMRKVMVR